MRDVIGKMQQFLYVREDSLYRRPTGLHTLTTERVKDVYMSGFKDVFERGILIPHSKYLLDEMKAIVRDGGSIEATGDAYDDRVVSAALAVKAWNDQLRTRLITQNHIWVPPEKRKELEQAPDTPLGRNIRNYLTNIGVIPKPQGEPPKVHAYNLPKNTTVLR
jgi:hypothetical protein